MPNVIEQLEAIVEATVPEKEELPHELHPKFDYAFLILRNVFVVLAALLFLASFFFHSFYNVLKAIAYFCGAVAYIFECLAVTDCFQTRVPHTEMFMVYCFGPLYILMGIGYLFFH